MLSSESSGPILLSNLLLLIFCLCKWKMFLIGVKFHDPFIESLFASIGRNRSCQSWGIFFQFFGNAFVLAL